MLTSSLLRRVVAAVPVVVLTLTAVPATAIESVGIVDVTSSGPSGSVDGHCEYAATLPGVERADVAPALMVVSTPKVAVNTADYVTAPGDFTTSAALPDSNLDYISVAFTGTATATPSKATVVAVSTSVRCYLRNLAWGAAGVTLPGSTATIAGQGDVYRLAPDPEICVSVAAAFSDGTTATRTTRCHNL